MPVHSLPEDQPYYLGVFFVGAYQETLGDLHNLFGDTNVVTIDLREDGGFDLLHEQEGDTISEVLSYVEYDPADCVAAFRKMVDEAISAGSIQANERKTLIERLSRLDQRLHLLTNNHRRSSWERHSSSVPVASAMPLCTRWR